MSGDGDGLEVERMINSFMLGALVGLAVMGAMWGISDVNHPYPHTPAEWKAGYEQAMKDEQARHAKAMGMEVKR